MTNAVDGYDQIAADYLIDRRNGYYRRHLLTELGDIELQVPRMRHHSAVECTREMAGFVLGLSTRKVGETLLALLGRSVSASTLSQVGPDTRCRGGRISQSAVAEPPHLLPLQIQGATPQGTNHKCYRTAAP